MPNVISAVRVEISHHTMYLFTAADDNKVTLKRVSRRPVLIVVLEMGLQKDVSDPEED